MTRDEFTAAVARALAARLDVESFDHRSPLVRTTPDTVIELLRVPVSQLAQIVCDALGPAELDHPATDGADPVVVRLAGLEAHRPAPPGDEFARERLDGWST